MRLQWRRTLGLLSLVVLGYGCQTLNDVVRAKNDGTTKVYPVTADQAWTIAAAVFRWEGSDAIEEHRDQGYMLTSSGFNFLTAGTVMGAWIEPVAEGKTQVTVVTKRRIVTNLVTTLTETTFHRRFTEAMKIIKAGQPLPLVAPD